MMTDDNSGLTLKEWVARLDGKLDAFAASKADRADVDRLQLQINEVEHLAQKVNNHLQEQVALGVYRTRLWKVGAWAVGACASIGIAIASFALVFHK